MENAAATVDLTQYFDCSTYSDITIRYNGREIKAHKLVLAQGSDYFRACFGGNFVESTVHVAELRDDKDPRAVRVLIAYLYGVPYETSVGSILANKDFGNHDLWDFFVNVYVTAAKYLVPRLCDYLTDKLPPVLAKTMGSKGLPIVWEDIARSVYLNYTLEAEALRKSIVIALVDRMEAFKDEERFRDLLLDIPQLAFEIVQQQAKMAHESKGNAKPKKRAR